MAAEKRLRREDSGESEGDDLKIMLETVMERMERNMEEKIGALVGDLRNVFNEIKEVNQTVKRINSKVDKHESILNSLKEKVEKNNERLNEVHEEMGKSTKEVNDLKTEIGVLAKRLTQTEEKLIDQEARSRRCNLIFHGIKEEQGEDCKKIVMDVILKDCKEENIILERVHRIGRKNNTGTTATRPRPIIARFLDFNHLQRVRAARRKLPENIRISEDLPAEVRQARRVLMPDLIKAKSAGQQAWLAYPARLVVDGKEIRSIQPRPSTR